MHTRRGVGWTAWALLGVIAVFVQAVWSLGERGIITVRAGLAPFEWTALALLLVAFVYGEGVRALQRRWIPHVLARSAEVSSKGIACRLLAPLYAMMLIGAPPRTLVRAWVGVALIVLAVLIVRAMPEPWRGIVDLAVAAALGWGLLVLLYGGARVLGGNARVQGATS